MDVRSTWRSTATRPRMSRSRRRCGDSGSFWPGARLMCATSILIRRRMDLMAKEGLDDAFAAGKSPEDLVAGATKEPPGDDGTQVGRKSQASVLIEVASSEAAEFFHDQ